MLWLKPNSSAKRKLHSHDIIFSTRKLSQAIIKALKSLHSPTKVMEALLLWLKPNSSAKRKLHSHDIIFSTRKLSYNAKVSLHPISQRQKSQSIVQEQANHVAKQQANEHTSDPSGKQQEKKANEHTSDWQSSCMQKQIRRGWLIV